MNRSKRFPIFVANRLAIIESSDPSQWHFLSSKLNAADLPSCGLMDKPIDCLTSWLKGPQFLWELKALWPQYPVTVNAQISKKFFPVKHRIVFSNIVTGDDCAISHLIEHGSSLYKLKRLMAWLLCCQTKFSCCQIKIRACHFWLMSYATPTQNLSNFYNELIFLAYSLNQSKHKKWLQKLITLTAKTTSSYFGWQASCG